MSDLRLFDPERDDPERAELLRIGRCPDCGEALTCCLCDHPDEPLDVQFAFADLDREELEDLLKDFHGDTDAMFGYLWALSKDD
jgi:hypothetical protein